MLKVTPHAAHPIAASTAANGAPRMIVRRGTTQAVHPACDTLREDADRACQRF